MINKQAVREALERRSHEYGSARELAENVAREMFLGDEFDEVRVLADGVFRDVVLERTFLQA